ncbi:MAG TPA: carbohydrate ABC transporter permease [Flexilinea sp.]|nr:carbohydrate ABC transporter permease [Flexilinea sp.]
MKIKRKWENIVFYIVLILLAAFWMAPLILALLNSFKSNGELLTNILSIPKTLSLINYKRSIEKMHFFRSMRNTLFLSIFSVVLIVFFSSLAGWKLCRTKTKLSSMIYHLIIFSMLIPFSSIMIPLYRVVLAFHIKNNLFGLSFVYAGLGVGMAIFLYYQFVKEIPIELEEAAEMDGSSQLNTFFKIIFPLLKNVTITVCITNFLWIWNDFLLPLIMISDNKKYTLILSTNTLFGQYSNDWSAILSALIMVVIPAIIIYILFQKQIMHSITDSAIKG